MPHAHTRAHAHRVRIHVWCACSIRAFVNFYRANRQASDARYKRSQRRTDKHNMNELYKQNEQLQERLTTMTARAETFASSACGWWDVTPLAVGGAVAVRALAHRRRGWPVGVVV